MSRARRRAPPGLATTVQDPFAARPPAPALPAAHRPIPARGQARTWTKTAQLQDVSIRVHADHPELHRLVQHFLAPLAGGDGAPAEVLELFLHLRRDAEPDLPIPSGPPAEIRFVNVSCFREGSTLSFRSRDGSGLEADIAAGRAWGTLTPDLAARRYVLADLLLAPLMEMLKHRGYYGLHAATLSRNGTGYLFPATAGQGKTTVALGLLKQRFQYVGDDKVLLREQDGEIAALAFTRRFNIDPDIGDRYRELAFVADLEPLPLCEKRPVDVSAVYPGSFVPRCRPGFVIHLQRTPGADSRIVPLSRSESFARLIRQTILAFDQRVAMRQLALFGRLLERADSYLLYNGDDLYGEPARLVELLPRV